MQQPPTPHILLQPPAYTHGLFSSCCHEHGIWLTATTGTKQLHQLSVVAFTSVCVCAAEAQVGRDLLTRERRPRRERRGREDRPRRERRGREDRPRRERRPRGDDGDRERDPRDPREDDGKPPPPPPSASTPTLPQPAHTSLYCLQRIVVRMTRCMLRSFALKHDLASAM